MKKYIFIPCILITTAANAYQLTIISKSPKIIGIVLHIADDKGNFKRYISHYPDKEIPYGYSVKFDIPSDESVTHINATPGRAYAADLDLRNNPIRTDQTIEVTTAKLANLEKGDPGNSLTPNYAHYAAGGE